MKIKVAPEVIDWIIDVTCKDRSYGARPLRRAIQRYVEDPLSRSSFAATCATARSRSISRAARLPTARLAN
jgi:ATP-dependent Clp protease ATP-binding subunit ClpA